MIIIPEYPLHVIDGQDIPLPLRHIPHPPLRLFVRGDISESKKESGKTILTIVGSRHPSSYGREVTTSLIHSLRGYPVIIVSGLAIGIDSWVHETALEAGLITYAFPGSGLNDDVIHPHSSRPLAERIVRGGGALISEYEPTERALPWMFVRRNRLMAGISSATLIIEATRDSGTLTTARLALDYNRDTLIVPGHITSPLSEGPHILLRDGATPITSRADLISALGFARPEAETLQTSLPLDISEKEKRIMILIREGPISRDALIRMLNVPPYEISSTLTELEIKGYIDERDGVVSFAPSFPFV